MRRSINLNSETEVVIVINGCHEIGNQDLQPAIWPVNLITRWTFGNGDGENRNGEWFGFGAGEWLAVPAQRRHMSARSKNITFCERYIAAI